MSEKCNLVLWHRFVLPLVLLSAATASFSQSLPFKSFSSDDGLAQSVVLTMTQDSSGYLWFGTPSGVCRFDGLIFTNYDEADGLPGNVVRSILEGADKSIWVGTDEGLSRWHHGQWERPVQELDGLSVRCLIETPDQVLWAGTDGAGVARIDGRQVDFFTTENGLALDRVRSATIDRSGKLWFGTYGGGASRLEGDRFASFATAQGLGDLFVRTLYEDREGRLLATTNDGVFVWTGEGFDRFGPTVKLQGATITTVLEDRNRRIWVGSRDLGACLMTNGDLRCLGQVQGLADNAVNDIVEDNEGNLWFATFGGGVSRLSTESFHNYTSKGGLPSGSVQAFTEIGGSLWIGTHGGGIARKDGDTFTVFTTDHGLPHNKVLATTSDHQGKLLVGTLGGAARLDGPRFTPINLRPNDAPAMVYFILASRTGAIWYATFKGLIESSEGKLRSYTVADGLPSSRINHLLEDRDGRIWIATAGGLSRFEDGSFVNFTESDGLVDNFVHWIHESDEGVLWIATVGGLSRFADGVFTNLTTRDGLTNNRCSFVLEDDDGNLWIGTTRGLNIFDGRAFRNFTVRDGLPSSEILPGAGYRDASGRMWIGTVRGATVFDPDARHHDLPVPRSHITRFEIADQLVDPDGVHRFSHEQNSLRFEFVAPCMTYPQDVEYEYRLTGLDSRPRRTRSRTADYPSVPPGRYTFTVRARHGPSDWGPTASSTTVQIAPPFWQTYAFRLLISFAILGALTVAHLARLRASRIREKKLAGEVRERTAELRAERQEVRRKNEQLEVTNSIVRLINEQIDFSSLLGSTLEGVSAYAGTTSALALVVDEESGELTVLASLLWPDLPDNPEDLSLDALEKEILSRATRIDDGLYIARSDSSVLDGRLGSMPKNVMIMVVEIAGRPAGYLFFGSTEAPSLTLPDLEALTNLKGHVASAFIKGRMVFELRELNEKKNEFLGIAAHDLRSPLGSVISYTGLLLQLLEEDRVDKKRWRRFLTNVHVTADHMASLVNELLDVAAIEAGRVELKVQRLSMAEFLSEREAMLRPAAEDKRIDFEVDTTNANCEILADRLRVGEVLDNLIGNAFKFTERGGRVLVHCEIVENELVIHVRDSGQGLQPDDLARIFSGKKLSVKPTGGESSTGLGLVIVKKLVERHSGKVWVQSTSGEGSTFSFSLPMCR